MIKDMTVGNPMKLIISFSIPVLIGNIFQQFYNMVDAIIVGQFISANALAAVGLTGALSFLLLGFVWGMTGGFSVIAAQRFGANDEDGLRHAVAMSVYLSVAITVVLTLVGVLGARPMLKMMNTPDEILDDAYNYIVVIFAGIGATVFYNLLASILRALGDGKTPLYFLIISSLLNIILDLLFIITFKAGVAGAAYATVIAQLISGLLCLIFMVKKFPILHFRRRDWQFDIDNIMSQLRLGLPMALQFSITAIGIIVMQSAINGFGSTVVAAFTAANKIEQIVMQPFITIGTTCATYAGQNLGAGKFARIDQGVKKAVLLTVISALLGGLIIFIFGKPMMHMFLKPDQRQAIEYGIQYLNIIIIFFIPLGLIFVFRNTLQGVGKPFMPMMAGASELIMRCVFALLFARLGSYAGVCLSSPLAWIGAAFPLAIAYVYWYKRLPSDCKNKL